MKFKRSLPNFIAAILIVSAFLGVKSFVVSAQDSGSQISDYALDVQNGEKDTANDVDAQNNQKDIAQGEQVEAAVDDGDPSTPVVDAALAEAVSPTEAEESATLVNNPQATSSENDNGEVLKDQTTQTSQEKPNEDVNLQDDNKAPMTDPDTQAQTTTPQEQPLENLQNTQPEEQTNGGEGQ